MSFISFLEGIVVAKSERTVTLNVGNIGFSLLVANAHSINVGVSIKIITHMQWHSEQGFTLFGFITELEKYLFLSIIECSGIGPKLALTLLDNVSPAILIDAIQTDNLKVLSGVSGIGAKKAALLIVELKHKLPKILEKFPQAAQVSGSSHWHTVLQVLTSLQYGRAEIATALAQAQKKAPVDITFDAALRLCLQILTKM